MNKIKEFNRFILLSDIHFGVRSNSLEWIENIKNYFYNFFIPNLIDLSEDYNTAVIIAGDVFDNRQSLDIDVMNTAQEVFEKILSINDTIQIYCIAGNHDLYRKNKNETSDVRTSLKSLKMDRFNIILNNEEVELYNGMKMLFVPWIGNQKIENEIVKKSAADIIIMHTDINGAIYDNGKPITNGVNLNLTQAKKVYSGHIHKRQDSKRRTYIGTPYQINRADIGNEKGIYYITLHHNGFYEDFIINNYSPKFIRKTIFELMELTYDELIKIFNNNYVDIIIESKYLKDLSIAKLMNGLKDFKYKKIEIIVDKSDEEMCFDDEIFDSNVSIDRYIENHIRALEGVSDENKNDLLELNSEYIKQYMNE